MSWTSKEAAVGQINQETNIEQHTNDDDNMLPVLNIVLLQPEAEQGTRSSKSHLPYKNFNVDRTDESEIGHDAKALFEVMALEHNQQKSFSPVSALLFEQYIPVNAVFKAILAKG